MIQELLDALWTLLVWVNGIPLLLALLLWALMGRRNQS